MDLVEIPHQIQVQLVGRPPTHKKMKDLIHILNNYYVDSEGEVIENQPTH